VGCLVTSPIGGRYHPLIIGQATATIDNMYPGRFQLGIGTGEAINEINFFQNGMPKWRERIERLIESLAVMRLMWESEEYFNYLGKYFNIKNFFLYTKPKSKISIYFAAQGRKAANYAGRFGDHIVTVNSPEICKNVVFPSFNQAAKKVGKDPSKMEKMVEILLHFSEKKKGINQVRKSGEAGFFAENSFYQTDPRKIQDLAFEVKDKNILSNFCFVNSPDDLIETIEKYINAGANHIELVTHSFPKRISFIGEKVLPYFEKNRDSR
jgi:coenzyme F420-dependent glucose-6-phosphate dehydrogenase